MLKTMKLARERYSKAIKCEKELPNSSLSNNMDLMGITKNENTMMGKGQQVNNVFTFNIFVYAQFNYRVLLIEHGIFF